VGHLEQVSREADQILEPQRLEPQFGAQLSKLRRNGIVEEIVARDDGDGYKPLFVVSPESPQIASG
jgi:hypothetical protein